MDYTNINSKILIYLSAIILSNLFYLGFKDGSIVPGQEEQNGPSTLVKGSYPH